MCNKIVLKQEKLCEKSFSEHIFSPAAYLSVDNDFTARIYLGQDLDSTKTWDQTISLWNNFAILYYCRHVRAIKCGYNKPIVFVNINYNYIMWHTTPSIFFGIMRWDFKCDLMNPGRSMTPHVLGSCVVSRTLTVRARRYLLFSSRPLYLLTRGQIYLVKGE